MSSTFSSKPDVEKDGFTCYWRIENFPPAIPIDWPIRSPAFKANILNSKWSLELDEDDESEFISLYIYKEKNPFVFKVDYMFQILTNGGWITDSEILSNRFKAGSDGYGRKIVSWQNILSNSWTWLPGGSLTVCVHIMTNQTKGKSAQCLIVTRMKNSGSELKHLKTEYFNDLKLIHFFKFPDHGSSETIEVKVEMKTVGIQANEEMKTETTQTDEISPYKDRDDLLRFFKEKDFDFITLRTFKSDFTVHKAVLCAKSPVFNAMFERRMQENDSSVVVHIHDINGETLARLVRYLHFEPLKDLQWEDAVNLYYAADKYQIDQWKEICLIFLKQKMSLKTVCDAFVMADLHQDETFMQNAFEFFYENSKFILKSDEWKSLLHNKPELASEIFEKLADKM